MEKAILSQNPHWKNNFYNNLKPRECLKNLIKKLSLKEIQVLSGIRRSGKSSLFRLMINELLKKHNPKSILYLNLDDPFFSEIWNNPAGLHNIIEITEKLTEVKVCYLFLDEIQNVLNWEKYIKSAYDTEQFNKIFLTGSNARLLDGHYAKLLSGRFLLNHIYPLSLHEVLQWNDISNRYEMESKKPETLKIIEQIINFGSFPQIIKTTSNEIKRELLINYYETILLKDCFSDGRIRDQRLFREFLIYILSNLISPYSFNSLSRAIESNDNTIKEYFNILEEIFILSEIKQFSWSFKKQIKAKRKCFCSDNGLANALSFQFSENKGKMFENLVCTELFKLGKKDLYYFDDTNECDIIVKNNNEYVAIQVTTELSKHNYERELNGLEKTTKKFNFKKGFIVTINQFQKISKNKLVIPIYRINEYFS